MVGRKSPYGPVVDQSDLPMWANILLTGEMPIKWATEDGEPAPGDELVGQLVIGNEEQLIIDMCGTAATNLLAVLIAAHRDANVPLPAAVARART